jgi:hypothetical protein
MKESPETTIKLSRNEYTDLEVLARKRHTTVWLCILDAVRRKASNETEQNEDWWKGSPEDQ